MEFRRPSLADSSWASWLRDFPAWPTRDRFDLANWERRFDYLLRELPDPDRLSQDERAALKRWMEDYAFEFDLRQQEPVQVFEMTDLVNLGTIAVGLAAAPFLVPLTIGAFTVSACLWGWKISGNADRKSRQQHVQAIKRLLRTMAGSLA